MRVLTTTICYPTDKHPDQGVFIQRRAAGHGRRRRATVQVVSPQPWCPLLRRTAAPADQDWPVPATYPRMLSIPVLSWIADGVSFGRTLEQYIVHNGGPSRFDLIDHISFTPTAWAPGWPAESSASRWR
jgi:hypothetical protein